MDIRGKKISVIGAVRSGIGAAKLAKKLGALPFVSDSGTAEKLADSISAFVQEGIEYECGGHSGRIYDCDFIVTSPGIPTDSEVLSEAVKRGIKIFSEIEFASWFCRGSIISITGTNGKTTTTSLTAHTLNESGIKCYPAGNIGNAFSEIALDVNEDEYVALETSSFQLDFADRFKPKIAVILNITPDHLDRYRDSFDEYSAAKQKVASNQDADDFLIISGDDENIKSGLKKKNARIFYFSLKKREKYGAYVENGAMIFSSGNGEEEICKTADLFIRGEHNIANALAVMIAAKIIGVPNQKIKEAFGSFKGVEHRIEFVRNLDGVDYYNDSKATNADSVWNALRSFERPIFLILGGKDKGNNYEQIREPVSANVKKIYAIGSSAQKVFDFFSDFVSTEIKKTLEECVTSARSEAPSGSVVLLSPACASFDMFDNYEHRGRVFKEAVMRLT
jgi:UDP-N-acetylmuramoylalanine--D-glutamate ligase